MHIIQINTHTLEIIEVLNGGMRPDLEHCMEEPHFYVWNGPNEHAEIIHLEDFEVLANTCTQETHIYSK